MIGRRLFSWIVVAGLVLAWLGCSGRPADAPVTTPQRIVAMAPSLTETLIALGLEDRIVGITRYCPQVDGAEIVGGYFDPDYEAIVSLAPDLVLTMQSHDELHRRLKDLGIETFRVDQHDVEGILASASAIADRCGVAERGRELVSELETALEDIGAKVAGLPRPKTLVVVGREPGGGKIGGVWAAASDTFYDDVLRLAGGVNAVSSSKIRYPELGPEGLLAVDAEVIFDVIADGGARRISAQTAVADWRSLGDLRAVRDDRVHVLMQDHVVIPGPRIVDTVRVFARYLHPELSW